MTARYPFTYQKSDIVPTLANLEFQYIHLQQVFVMLKQNYENSKSYFPLERYRRLKAMVETTVLEKNLKRAGYFVQPQHLAALNKELQRMSTLELAKRKHHIANLRDRYMHAYVELYTLQYEFKRLSRHCCSARYGRLKAMIKRITHDDTLITQ